MSARIEHGQLPPLDVTTLWNAIESAAEQASIGVYLATLDADRPRILYVSVCAARILGRSADELVGSEPLSMLREQDRAAVRASMERPAGAAPALLELIIDRPDGRSVPVTLASSRMHTASGVLGFGYLRDLSQERETIEALRRSEARFRFLVEAAPDGVVILQRGTIVFINPKAAHLLGVDTIDAALGRPIASFLPAADAAAAGQRIMAMLRDGIEFPPSEYGVLADPARVVEIKSIVCEWNGGPAVLAFARDVTERKAIEGRLIESDRLAALGTLAAGVAHEINNPLTYAQLSAQRISRLLERADVPTSLRGAITAHLDDIEHGIRRVASITHSLRSFVTHDDEVTGPVDVHAALARALKMVDNEIRHAALLIEDLQPVPLAIGNASRLEQVFVNVLINARKALPANPATPHEIRVALTYANDHVTVTIADTGCGIPAALRGRIFDPFFTTRDTGHGMGLGLSVSKTIVEKLGGTIEVDSTENVGTTVRVHLRAHTGAVKAARDVPARAATQEHAGAHGLRILIVDDEPIICDVLQRILGENHDVTIATAGADALSLLVTQEFDLILCDVMMPGMNADELYRRIAAARPELVRRIAFMTGGALGGELDDLLDALPNPRLGKPFRIDEVLALVNQFAR